MFSYANYDANYALIDEEHGHFSIYQLFIQVDLSMLVIRHTLSFKCVCSVIICTTLQCVMYVLYLYTFALYRYTNTLLYNVLQLGGVHISGAFPNALGSMGHRLFVHNRGRSNMVYSHDKGSLWYVLSQYV